MLQCMSAPMGANNSKEGGYDERKKSLHKENEVWNRRDLLLLTPLQGCIFHGSHVKAGHGKACCEIFHLCLQQCDVVVVL